jgi:hypothetical protein
LWIDARVVRGISRNTRFGEINSRLGPKIPRLTELRELAGKGLICFTIFGAETALFRNNREKFPVPTGITGNLAPTGEADAASLRMVLT